MLYADDTILISDDPAKLQKCLDDFTSFCNTWKLNINVEKTKSDMFGSRSNRNLNFTIENREVEIITAYTYLGTYFNKSGSFLTTRKHLVNQAKKALHLLYR